MPASGLHLLFLDPSSMRIWALFMLTSWLEVNIQLRANLGHGSGPSPEIWLVGGDLASYAWPRPCPGPHEVQQPRNQLPCVQGGPVPAKNLLLPSHGGLWLGSVLPDGHSPSVHTMSYSLNILPSHAVASSWASMRAHILPNAQTPLSQGHPWPWPSTLLGTGTASRGH